ncbi:MULTISPECIES: MutS family DNA mismatch repair protein [Clostridium]|uniref:DNA mismatch repair protein MutS n=1 Tax=Clostridium cibarium TaxID=2762247 RepID=A0ABR8PR71_9CLOT|nr:MULTISPECIES: MutS family DNA mismatch repair protein [Clostridium]MBD7910671.1 DNA mismatch repair protein MutS [Clostridium cibarium]
MSRAEAFYNENIEKNKSEICNLNKKIEVIGWCRLVILISGLIFSYRSYKSQGFLTAVGILSMTALIFLAVAFIHGKIIGKREKLDIELEFNEKGLKRLKGEYKEFEDDGKELLEENHAFADDLDIFGKNSLFQMINTTRTLSGRRKLGEILSLKKLPNKNSIKERQVSIKELGEKVKWRQQLYVDATFKKKKGEELEELIKWGKESSTGDNLRIGVASLFILITAVIIFLCIVKVIPFSFLILNFMINYVVIKVLTKDRNEVIELFNSIKNSVKAYSNILTLIEDESFNSPYLNRLKEKLKDDSGLLCKNEMRKLSNLLDWVGDSAGNAYFFILNVVVFADVFILFNLNRWRKINGSKIENWLEVMGEFDALASISNLSFDYEDWCYAEITDESGVVGREIKHPLIGDRAVANDYELIKPKQITLITGSNMSGKSTFLRTVGINLILSYIGAPCSAKSFKCSIMNIYTCMRTKDNLEESISSFYAEILRIKLIIEACKRGEKLFFLLDEIFKGTNSKDRHTGATVLVKQLADNGATGLLSTHDLELCDLEEEMKEIENYNFREYYKDNKINFDYKLRRGKSTTQNAVYLMKLAGIEIKK